MSVFVTKTYYDCIDAAAEKASKLGVGLNSRTIIFCEDKLTLSLEKALVEKAGGCFGAEVLSFGRYVTRLSPNRKTLSKEGAAMAVKKILSENAKDLKTLASLGASPALASKTAELIAQLKSAKITPENLFSCIDGCPQNVGAKISDIALAFEKYEEFLAEKKLTDSNNALEDMVSALEKDVDLKNTRVIIAGYSSVTKQSCEVMRTLFLKANSCDFFAVSGDNGDLYTQEFLNFLIRLTNQTPIYIPSSLKPEHEAVLSRLFKAEDFEKVGLYSDKVKFFEANTVAEEVENLARFIKKTVKQTGTKYSDIAVGVGNLGEYSLLIERKFSQYGIPFFTDSKRKLTSHPLSKLTVSLLSSCVRRLTTEDIERVINNSLFISEKDIADKLIYYMTANSVTATSFLKDRPDFSDDADCLILSTKWNILADFIENLPKKASAKTYVDLLEKFITSSGISLTSPQESSVKFISEKLSLYKEEEQRSFLESGIVKIGEIFTEISSILGEELLTAEELLKLLKSGFEAGEISLIPEYYDCVYVSELKNCRFRKYDYLFAIGLSGDVPSVKADTALLVDSEISKLESLSLSIEPKIRVVNKREKEATAIALCSFEKGLYLSYSLLSFSGAQLSKSEIVDYLLKIFSTDEVKVKPINFNLLKGEKYADNEFLSLRPTMLWLAKSVEKGKDYALSSPVYSALKIYDGGKELSFANELIENAESKGIFYLNIPVNNYFSRGNVSASTIETYYSCPYKCFMKYGVGLADSTSSEIQTRDVGNVMHDLAEKFMKALPELNSEKEVEEKAKEIFDGIFDDENYKRFLKRPDYAFSTSLLKEEAVKLCLTLYKEQKNSDFRPIGMETWFADWAEGPYKSYKLPTERGNFKLFGKVDRIDKYKNYVRIIDYKTGNAKEKIKDEKFYTGQNLQLFLYMNAFVTGEDKPAGAYYYAVTDDFVSDSQKTVSMYGNTLKDKEIILATDKEIENNLTSTVINASIKNTKKGQSLNGSTVDERVFSGYMNYSKYLAAKAIDDVNKGVAVPSPYEGACKYCEFGALCGFDGESGYCERKVNSVKPETIVDAAKKEDFKRNGGKNIAKEEE